MRVALSGLVLLPLAALFGCSMNSMGETGGGYSGGDPASQGHPGAGVLTAGAWDDNLNFDFYQAYLSTKGPNIPGALAVARQDRTVITVTEAGGNPAAGIRVRVLSAGHELFHSITGAEGTVYFFPSFYGAAQDASLVVEVGTDSQVSTAPLPAGATNLTMVYDDFAPVTGLDVAFVVDTTGSMGDEISFVRGEFRSISASLAARFPGVTQRFALVLYRDSGDEYVVRSTDFVSDADTFQGTLGGVDSGGGGDYPEAPDQALGAAAQLSWRDGPTARVVFWVADAPQHTDHGAAMVDAIVANHQRGVHIYPIAASGADDLVEFSMRTAAQVTGGRYLFLTDDSGVGGAHQEPTLPCYQVTLLTHAMVRMLSIEVGGHYLPPAAEDVIRVGGDPHDGRCALQNGSSVMIF